MNILLNGTCGYKGTVLIHKLLTAGQDVFAFDIMLFGSFLSPSPNLKGFEDDVRNIKSTVSGDSIAIVG